MTKKLEAIITHQKGAQNAPQEYQINHKKTIKKEISKLEPS